MKRTAGLKGLGGSITFESLSRLFPGVSEPPTGLVCLHFVAQAYPRMRFISRWRDIAPTLQLVWLVFRDSVQ